MTQPPVKVVQLSLSELTTFVDNRLASNLVLSSLGDVTIGSASAGQVLTYTGSPLEWRNAAATGGGGGLFVGGSGISIGLGSPNTIDVDNTVVRTNAQNTLQQANTFTASLSGNATAPALLQSAAPGIIFDDTGADADESIFRVFVSSGTLTFDVRNDAGSVTNSWLTVSRTGATVSEIQFDATSLDINGNIDVSGTVTTPNVSASEVGFKGAPINTQNGDYTLALTDAGRTIYKASGGSGETITIPANETIAFPVGTVIAIINNGGDDLSIAITSDTLILANDGSTGTRTLADHGMATITKVESTVWFIAGAGVT